MVLVVGLLVISLLLRNDRGVILLHLWRTMPESHPFSITPLSLQRRWGVLLAGMLAFLLFAPLGWFFWQHPDQVLFRFKQVTVVDSLAQHAAPDSALKNIWATVKMYGLFDGLGDHTSRRNLGGEPALNLWLALAFYIGVVLTVWRLRRVSYMLVLLSLVGLLLPGAPTEHAPQFGRLIGGTAPSALLCAVGLDWLWQWRPNRATYLRWSSILLIVLGGVTTTYDYFGRWATLPSLYGAFDVGVWQLTQQLRHLPPELPVYLAIQNPQVHAVQFAMQTEQHPEPVTFDGRHIVPLTAQPSTRPARYVILADHRYTEKRLAQIFPEAKVQQEVLDPAGNLFARIYEVPANARPQYPPSIPFNLSIGDGIELLGYTTSPAPAKPGKNLYVEFQWLVSAKPTQDWIITVGVTATTGQHKGQRVAAQVNRPGEDSLLTNRWQPGWRLVDEYQIKLPPQLTPGAYKLTLQLSTSQGRHFPADGTIVTLGDITVE